MSVREGQMEEAGGRENACACIQSLSNCLFRTYAVNKPFTANGGKENNEGQEERTAYQHLLWARPLVQYCTFYLTWFSYLSRVENTVTSTFIYKEIEVWWSNLLKVTVVIRTRERIRIQICSLWCPSSFNYTVLPPQLQRSVWRFTEVMQGYQQDFTWTICSRDHDRDKPSLRSAFISPYTAGQDLGKTVM